MGELTDVTYEVENGLAWITINRPARYNSFRAQTVDELIKSFKRAWVSDEVGVICLTGAGDKAWCTGIDRHESLENYGTESARAKTTVSTAIQTKLTQPPRIENRRCGWSSAGVLVELPHGWMLGKVHGDTLFCCICNCISKKHTSRSRFGV